MTECQGRVVFTAEEGVDGVWDRGQQVELILFGPLQRLGIEEALLKLDQGRHQPRNVVVNAEEQRK